MIYIWTIGNNYPEELIGEYDKDLSPDRFIFKRAEKITIHTSPVVRFSVSADDLSMYDDLASNVMVPIISPKIASILNEFESIIQLIDVRILAKDRELPGYKLLNALETANALDRKNSEFNYIPGTEQIMGFRKLSYLDAGLTIARDKDYMSNLLVNECIAKKISEASPLVGIYKPGQLEL